MKLPNVQDWSPKTQNLIVIGGSVVAVAGSVGLLCRYFKQSRNCSAHVSLAECGNCQEKPNMLPSVAVDHFGVCHCGNIRFKIRAPRIINAVDIPSKIRFPRVTIPCSDFELLCDDKAISTYTVKCGDVLGIHSFCSYCGVQIVYAPTVEPVEVQVNVDCLARDSIDSVHVTYHSCTETKRLHHNHELAHMFNRRGLGADHCCNNYQPLSSDSLNLHQQQHDQLHLQLQLQQQQYLQNLQYDHQQSHFQQQTRCSPVLTCGGTENSHCHHYEDDQEEDEEVQQYEPATLNSFNNHRTPRRRQSSNVFPDLNSFEQKFRVLPSTAGVSALRYNTVSPLDGTAEHSQSAFPATGSAFHSTARPVTATDTPKSKSAMPQRRRYSNLSDYSAECAQIVRAKAKISLGTNSAALFSPDTVTSRKSLEQPTTDSSIACTSDLSLSLRRPTNSNDDDVYTDLYVRASSDCSSYCEDGGATDNSTSGYSNSDAMAHSCKPPVAAYVVSTASTTRAQQQPAIIVDDVATPLTQCRQMKKHLNRHMSHNQLQQQSQQQQQQQL